jgi:putative component of toxin-antitoxin plasmid stabilization module
MYTIKRMPEFDEWLASLRDGMLMVMLGGGDKSTQSDDIARAIALSRAITE